MRHPPSSTTTGIPCPPFASAPSTSEKSDNVFSSQTSNEKGLKKKVAQGERIRSDGETREDDKPLSNLASRRDER